MHENHRTHGWTSQYCHETAEGNWTFLPFVSLPHGRFAAWTYWTFPAYSVKTKAPCHGRNVHGQNDEGAECPSITAEHLETYQECTKFYNKIKAMLTSHNVRQYVCMIVWSEFHFTDAIYIYSVSQKKIPLCGFLKFFPKRLGIFNQFFTHLLYDHFYPRVQIFIQISPTLTKLCHTKRGHLANFYISLEL